MLSVKRQSFLFSVWGDDRGNEKNFKFFGTHHLTVLTMRVIVQIEQREQIEVIPDVTYKEKER